ncbi:NADPH:quinone reductase [Aspergillus oryzae]|uniref:NADPH:quinone reductase n=1 Tax=Aspergillus oryzae TaxID=5062 RepID=A0A1S9DX17_ASPOZ|nr:NADPH:quinone reductase [Aspergillus oryzae]
MQRGEPAKNSTPNEERVSAVVEVGGPASLRQALTALKFDGSISMVGSVGGFVDPGSNTEEPTFFDTAIHSCTVRGIAVGSRLRFEDTNRAIEVNDLHPVLDRQTFKLEEARDAYQYI